MTVLGRYQILEQLGTGSMGTVYRARDSRLDRDVALKTIRTSGEVEPEIRERFYREARACARLQHPNIVAVFDLGEEQNVAYIAMELLKGEDFRKVIEKRREIPLAKKVEAMIQVCEGLHHAHARGVIHRDIKPSNLFFTEDGQAKVMDFGIARLPSSRLTVAGNILGTPNYMAPEQMLGRPTDARTDLFSAALVFFELLVYTHPFHAPVIPKRIVEGEPDSLFDHDSTLPVLLEKILGRALCKDPLERYETGEQIAGDLRAVLDGIRLNASPTMSRVELPSDRALPKDTSVPEGDLTLLKPTPEGEDPAEWRLSEVLRLIPHFEEAVDRKDQTVARNAMEELRAIATADHRFTEAAESCQSTYEKVWGQVAAGGAGNVRSTAAAASVTTAPNPAGTAALKKDKTLTGPVSASAKAPPIKAAATVKRPNVRGFGPDQKKALIAAAVLLVAIIAIGWTVSQFTRPVPMQPAIATAKVRSPHAAVHKAADASSEQILSVDRGETLRVLEVPRARKAEWIWVQPLVNGKAQVPGFAKLADVTDWTEWSYDAGSGAADVAQMMSPRADASDEEVKGFINKLRSALDRVTGSGQPSEQRLEQQISDLEQMLRKREEAQMAQAAPGFPPGDTTSGTAAPPAGSPESQTAATERSRVQGGAPGQQPPAADDSPEALLRRAKRMRDQHNLKGARALAVKLLEKDPNSAPARDLLKDIEQLEKLDELTR